MKKNLDKSKTYLVAVSGGVDSCVLFDILVKEKYDFIVIHFNHHTRGEDNIKDLNLVQNMCSINHKELYIYDYIHEHGNFQSSARQFRIDTYKRLVKRHHLAGVILAHHGDDQIENILMHDQKPGKVLMQDVKTIDGIDLYRPLLSIYKDEIYGYAKMHNVAYCEDSSNHDQKYRRNYFRDLNNYTSHEKDLILKLQVEREKYYDQVMLDIGRTITKDYYLSFGDPFLLIYLFIKNEVDQNISIKLLTTIINMIDFKGYKQINLPGDYLFIQEYQQLYITKSSIKVPVVTQELKLGLNTFNGITFENKVPEGQIRVRQAGDIIKESYGHKKVTRKMIDLKIPKNLREIWPIIINEKNEILYIPKPDKK